MGTIANCGPQPALKDYGSAAEGYDTESYRSDLAAWRACMAAPSPVGASSPIQAAVANDPDGAIAEQALAWLPANLPGGTSNSIYQSWRAQIVSALKAGILDPGGQYATRTGKCGGSSSPSGVSGVQIGETALSIAGTGATTGLAIAGVAGATVPIVGAGIAAASLLISLFSKLFGPATSALEQKYLCPLVSSANAVLLQIVAELNGALISAAQAGAAFDSLYAGFHGQLLQSVPNAGPLLYYNTPNDSQFMDSSLAALGIKYKTTIYPQLEAAASTNKATQQAASTATLQAQVNADVAKAIASNNVPAMRSTLPVSSAPSIVVYAGIGAVIAVAILLLFL